MGACSVIGPGFFVAALLFGLVHVLNPSDIFGGEWLFDWSWGLASLHAGVFFALLRVTTGTVWAGVVMHFVHNACFECLAEGSLTTALAWTLAWTVLGVMWGISGGRDRVDPNCVGAPEPAARPRPAV